MAEIAKCAVCRNRHEKARGRKTCSDECRRKYNRKRAKKRKQAVKIEASRTVDCDICGVPFVKQSALHRYCTDPCQRIAKRMRLDARNELQNAARAKAKPVPKCQICGAVVTAKGRHKFCSDQCYKENHRQRCLSKKEAAEQDKSQIDLEGERFEPSAEYIAEIERRKAELKRRVYGDGPPTGLSVECETPVVDARIFEGLPGWF